MDPALATRERPDLALRHVFPALGGSQRKRSLEDNEKLLALQVVMEVHPRAGRQLVDGQPEMFRARLSREPRAPVPVLVPELVSADVRHAGVRLGL